MDSKHLKIDLGAGDIRDGESSPEGYLRQDVDESIKGIDLVCNIDELDTVLDPEQCLKIRASHVMEHFPTKELPDLFKMIYDLLEPGGNFELIVPNFAWHCELVLQGEEEQGIHYAFGGQLDDWDFHKTGFTPRITKKLMKQAGFTIIHFEPGTSIVCIGEKPNA